MVRAQGSQEFQNVLSLLNDGSCASITLLFSLYSIKTFTAPCHYSFKKRKMQSMQSMYLHFTLQNKT